MEWGSYTSIAINCSLLDKAYIVMKKVPYDVIQKKKKLRKDFEHFNLILLCFKKGIKVSK